MDSAPTPLLTFIVRVSGPPGAPMRGTVERVRTGRKERFEGVEALGRIIEQAAKAESERPAPAS